MQVVISLLRGVNLAANNRMKMEDLRTLFTSLKFRGVQTYVQSGNVIFRTADADLPAMAQRISAAIAKKFGIRTSVMLRTLPEIREIVARNPFASQPDIVPAKLIVTFLPVAPEASCCEKALAINKGPEVVHINNRELYIYFPDGQGLSKFPWPAVERALGTAGTSRNWNSVTKILEIAEKLHTSSS